MAKSLGEAGWMFGVREDDQDEHQLQMSLNHHHQFQHQSPAEKNPSMVTSASTSTQKKKRTHPDPDAEVIALSPKTLMATNRFICEVCKKGFQREQNLQLHRRGHNLPWKLKQKSTNEVRKKVYLCPESTCVHHHPSRALGDLTGIKKHFSRKHGEKKWKCEKCSKTYAVLSDWKAHSKTCGTKEYRCDCGTLFSRRDSFVTHQAFCDALTRQNELNPTNLSAITSNIFGPSQGIIANQHQVSPYRQGLNFHEDSFRYGSFLPPFSGSAIRPNTNTIFGSPNYHEEDQDHHSQKKLVFKYGMMHQLSQEQILSEHADHTFFSNIATKNDNIESPTDDIRSSHLSSASNLFANQPGRNEVNACSEIGGRLTGAQGSSAGLFSSDNVFMGDQMSPLYSSLQNNNNASASAHFSATALLQKAAQVGSSCSIINGSSSIHRSLGSSSSSSKHDDLQAISLGATSFGALLGDPHQNNKHLHELMSSLGGGGSMTTSSMFGGLAKENNDVCTGEYASNEETKFSFDEYSKVNIGGCDRLTRDFMGVGQIVRQMSGGFSQTGGLQMTSKTSIEGIRDLSKGLNNNVLDS